MSETIPEREDSSDAYADARKVLDLVGELHRRGYERLRIVPGMSPSGLSWRCKIAFVENISLEHGARLARPCHRQLVASYISASGAECFGWTEAAAWSLKEMADAFVSRFSAVAESGRGADAAYAQWYSDMLSVTHPDAFPIADADWELPSHCLRTVGGRKIELPLPPISLSA